MTDIDMAIAQFEIDVARCWQDTPREICLLQGEYYSARYRHKPCRDLARRLRLLGALRLADDACVAAVQIKSEAA